MIACQDCRYYRSGFKTSRCDAPQLMTSVDYETGHKVRGYAASRPQAIREVVNMCGPQGRWFVRATWLDRLLRRF